MEYSEDNKHLMFMDSLLQGGHLSGFHNVHNRDAYDPRDPVMFHIRGDKPDQTRAIQVIFNRILFHIAKFQKGDRSFER